MKVLIDHCTPHQLHRMFARFYPDEPEHRSQEFLEAVKDSSPLSPAAIQGYFMLYKDDARGALDNAHKINTL